MNIHPDSCLPTSVKPSFWTYVNLPKKSRLKIAISWTSWCLSHESGNHLDIPFFSILNEVSSMSCWSSRCCSDFFSRSQLFLSVLNWSLVSWWSLLWCCSLSTLSCISSHSRPSFLWWFTGIEKPVQCSVACCCQFYQAICIFNFPSRGKKEDN